MQIRSGALAALATCCVLVSCPQASGQTEQLETNLTVQIVCGPGLPEAFAPSVAAFMGESLWLSAEVVPATPDSGSGAAGCASVPCADTNRLTICLDVSDRGPDGFTQAIILDREHQCARILVRALEPADATPGSAAEAIWLVRVQKQSAAAVARILGQPDCPFWLCVLHDDVSMEDLDFKARGPCPPCRVAWRERIGMPP